MARSRSRFVIKGYAIPRACLTSPPGQINRVHSMLQISDTRADTGQASFASHIHVSIPRRDVA